MENDEKWLENGSKRLEISLHRLASRRYLLQTFTDFDMSATLGHEASQSAKRRQARRARASGHGAEVDQPMSPSSRASQALRGESVLKALEKAWRNIEIDEILVDFSGFHMFFP